MVNNVRRRRRGRVCGGGIREEREEREDTDSWEWDGMNG